MLLTHADADSARVFDRRLRDRLVPSAQIQLGFVVDFSAGMAVYAGDAADLATLLARADKGLYLAKQRGRGRLEPAPA